jgi:hypothetical protein
MSYIIPADLSAYLIPRLEKTGMLFPKDAAKVAGDMFRKKGIAFPFGPGQGRNNDVSGFRHTLSTYRNDPTIFKGPDTMRGTHLATLMLHTRKASETTYRHGQTYLTVPGFNHDGTPSRGSAGASTSGTVAPKPRAAKPRPPTVAPPKPRAPRAPPKARGA